MSAILVTGGAGYIGSHTVLALLEAGHEVVVLDNFSHSHPQSLEVVKQLSQQDFPIYQGDVRDKDLLRRIFSQHQLTGVIHFAGLKAVGESLQQPLVYYDQNLIGCLHLLEVMEEQACKNLIFSSSAAVYGLAQQVPIVEAAPLEPTNPYGRSKQMVETLLRDLQQADTSWNIVILRYFNPIGAHPSGDLGEAPEGVATNLLPYVSRVAAGQAEYVPIFGADYATPDGTGVRDYIHVWDLSQGHVAALKKWAPQSGLSLYNLGTGRGYSVLEVIQTMSQVVGQAIPYRIYSRRPGDSPISYADNQKARRELGWESRYDLEDMCRHAWKWQSRHPQGFKG